MPTEEAPIAAVAPATKTDFQARLRLTPEPNGDHVLEEVAELALEALATEASGLALGPVAAIDLEQRAVWLEITVEASSLSEAHQKLGLILHALETGAPFVLQESTTSRSDVRDDARDPELVCA